MKSLVKVAVFSVLVIAANSAMAVIATTKHNLAGTATTDNGQMCVYCHTPHTNSTETSPPLWNHTATTALYTMYTSNTMNMVVATQKPGSESLVCLSCHDGTVALDSITNTPNKAWTPSGDKMLSSAFGYMGTDLRSEHPIGVTYNTSLDTAFNPVATATAGGMRFFGGGNDQVECASCHAVHNYNNVPFLRTTNDNSALCLACHIK